MYKGRRIYRPMLCEGTNMKLGKEKGEGDEKEKGKKKNEVHIE